MAPSKVRAGVGIREFLEHYLLVILSEGTATKQKMVELILERSSDNNHYRPEGALLVLLRDFRDERTGKMPVTPYSG